MSRIRLLAFFHDPVHKALVLAKKVSHEKAAKELASAFGISLTDDDLEALKGMDILASATERMVLPKGANRDPKYQVREFNEICFRHPLFGKEVHLNLEEDDYNAAGKALHEILQEFGDKTKEKNDVEKLAYIWHHILNELREKAPQIPWDLLPADTRVPDHTIWDHLKLTTAASAVWHEGKPYATGSIFIWTVGPVQSFIQQARKAQDFWAGSFALSFLTFKAIENVIQRYGPTIVIYPDLQAHPWILLENSDEIIRPTIPNRFVALLPESNPDTLKALGEKCDRAVNSQLKDWIDKILVKLNLDGNVDLERTVNRQLESAFVPFWIALPLPQPHNGRKDYQNAMELLQDTLSEKDIERMKTIVELSEGQETQYEPNVGTVFGFLYKYSEKALAARKSLRDPLFGPAEPGNDKPARSADTRVERCHLCGERNAIVRKVELPSGGMEIQYFNDERREWLPVSPQPEVGFRELPKNEALCAVCLIKRFLPRVLEKQIQKFPQKFSYPSVSDIAVADFMEKWTETPPEILKEFETAIGNLHVRTNTSPKIRPVPKIAKHLSEITEGEWFFEASLQKEVTERTLELKFTEKELSELDRAQKALQKLLEDEGRKPCPYYAFIAIDGDNMGKWLAGEMGFPLNDETNIYHPKVWKNLPGEFRSKLQEVFKLEENKWFRPVTPAYHASIAKALQTFALKIAPKIVEEQHLGQLIYAGGDDILAFVNLRDLWKVLRLLRLAYSGMVKVNPDGTFEPDKSNQTGVIRTKDGYWLTMGPRASLSAGVVIAHYKTPLALVISTGLAMEKKAKRKLGRNAFAMTWLKHSGEITETGAKWFIEDHPDLLESAEQVFSYFHKPTDEESRIFWLSRRLLKEVHDLATALIGPSGKGTEADLEFFIPLINRAIRRHTRFTQKLSQKEKENLFSHVSDEVFALLHRLNNDIHALVNLVEMGLLYTRFAKPEKEE